MEKADEAARRASLAPCTRRFPVPARDLRHGISAFVRLKWQNSWNERTDNKLRKIKPCLGTWGSSFRQSRREEVALCRIRVGHTLATHRYLILGEAKLKCRRCGDDLSVRHVLVSCRRYATERNKFFGSCRRRLSLRTLLCDDSPHIDNVFKYLAAIGFQIIFDPG